MGTGKGKEGKRQVSVGSDGCSAIPRSARRSDRVAVLHSIAGIAVDVDESRRSDDKERNAKALAKSDDITSYRVEVEGCTYFFDYNAYRGIAVG
jgi:hypothetical protein